MYDSSITFISQVIGPVAALSSLALLANQSKFKKILQQMASSEAMMFMVHTMRVIAGLGILALLPDSAQTPAMSMAFQAAGIVVTVIGAAGMLFPEVDAKVLKRTLKHMDWANAFLVVNLLVGVALMVVGYA